MPVIKSAAKRMRQNSKRYRENLRFKRHMRLNIKTALQSIDAKQKSPAVKNLLAAQKAIDKAVKKQVIHKNTGARKKSQLMKQFDDVFGARKKTAAGPKKTSGKTAAKPKTTARKKPATAKKS